MPAKIVVMYPQPTDAEAFERAYANEHVPMAVPVFKAAGVTRAVLTKTLGAPDGTAAYYRMAEIHFPSLEALQACATSADGQAVLADAHRISSGGAPVVMIAEEETVTL
jgi:uncharacterized protein (TIGR02118 family)